MIKMCRLSRDLMIHLKAFSSVYLTHLSQTFLEMKKCHVWTDSLIGLLLDILGLYTYANFNMSSGKSWSFMTKTRHENSYLSNFSFQKPCLTTLRKCIKARLCFGDLNTSCITWEICVHMTLRTWFETWLASQDTFNIIWQHVYISKRRVPNLAR